MAPSSAERHQTRDKSRSLSPLAALAPWDSHLAKLTAQSQIVDAKSSYDVLSNGSATQKEHRRDGDCGSSFAKARASIRLGASSSDTRGRPHEGGVVQDECDQDRLLTLVQGQAVMQ